ncbi:lipoprotein signal peptide [Enterovibrio norvegicus FF-33]|uniref:alpha/beta hydrolase family protein n=1 Tax=Enterovibrio norvegicus TaxID=188144 RepID=UPI0002F756F8|nr:alpha/beta fold hydrolase [Enterovibrio norvegicus]OEE66771.1 lipoprotein signal peptide [Enterovibrio norvegicus FF-33]
MNPIASLLLLFLSFNALANTVGFTQFQLEDDPHRPLNVTLWYPTIDISPAALVADNIAFQGTPVVKNAIVNQAQHPVVLLSHGYRGSWRNLNWLANDLVKKGYIVAAPDHPGTTTFDLSPHQAEQWWQRPRDLTRVLDFLLGDERWNRVIDANNISAVGHSLGGWSVAQLVGAKFDRDTFQKQCLLFPNPRTCGLATELGLQSSQMAEPTSSDFSDDRFKHVVILDLGLARSFSTASLNTINTPVLILAAGIDIGDLPQALESGYLAEHIPLLNRRYKVFEQATHFSFMQLCKPGANQILEEERPGDGVVCKDGVGTDRNTLHDQIFTDITQFFNSAVTPAVRDN